MIPSIEQIVEGLLNGSYTREQALSWLEEHINIATDSGYEQALQENDDD